jgi:hypothetical protein
MKFRVFDVQVNNCKCNESPKELSEVSSYFLHYDSFNFYIMIEFHVFIHCLGMAFLEREREREG